MNTNFIYSMTNSNVSNEIVAFQLDDNSNLIEIGAFETGGKGSGVNTVDPLVSQGSIVISKEYNLLFAVNAGSNTISVFRILFNGALSLISLIPSNGVGPNALGIYRNLLVVSNTGDLLNPSNIFLLAFDSNGKFKNACPPIYSLSNSVATPSSVIFTPTDSLNSKVAVAELNFSRISVFNQGECGLGTTSVNEFLATRPFALISINDKRILAVKVGTNELTSYLVEDNGFLTELDTVGTSGQASCWVSVTPSYGYAYVSNTASGTISIFAINQIDGTLTFLGTVDSVPGGGAAPIDSSISSDGRYFYVLNGDTGSVSAFRIELNGLLTFVDEITSTSLPSPGAQGMAAL